jgi:hypothetical protein
MLEEARSRMVDVETGEKPRPIRTSHVEPPVCPPKRPGSGNANGRAVKRPSSRRAPAGMPLRHTQPEVSAQQTPPSVPSPSYSAETDSSLATFGTDGLLWLGEPSDDPFAEPGDTSAKLPPWRRGLRG